MSFEHDVFLIHADGKLDAGLCDIFLPNGCIKDIEGPMWDYKTGYCNPKNAMDSEASFLCDSLKDIAAFYNCFGGYIIYAYRDDQLTYFSKFLNNDEFNQLSDRYLRSYIPVSPFSIKAVVDGEVQNILFLYISKRSTERPPVAFIRNAAEDANRRCVFKTGDIPLRNGSSTLIVNHRHDLLVFAFGERRPDIGAIPNSFNEVDNNLPARDPNLIEFIGRREYLIGLWNWLADRRNPVKVLTALGGTGKTAIAYEFCEQLVKLRGNSFSKVIWLTAKSQTYAAILQQYVSTTRTDFTDVDSFLNAFLREIGCLDSDFNDFDSLDDKLDFAKEMVKDIPILLVIDDLDSLDNEKQIDLHSRIAQLFDQASSGEAKSRVLFTSRLEPNAGGNRLMKVVGFGKEELTAYVDTLIRHLDPNNTWGGEVRSKIDILLESSKGSPIFVASILRLVSFGEPVETVIANWRGRDGEDVRRFAFKREIDSLNYPDWRVLYVLQLLSATTFEELKELLLEDRHRLQASLLRLSQFHMFSGGSNPSTGTQISVPEPIRLMISITEENLRSDDAEDLRKRCARVNRQADGQSEASRELRSITLLWRRKLFDQALFEAKRASQAHPKSGDLSCILGRTYLLQTTPDFDAADDAFKDAYQKKCDRAELREYWALSKLKRGDISGLLRITAQTEGAQVSGVALMYRFAGLYRIARQREDRNDFAQSAESYYRLQKEIIISLQQGLTDPVTADVKRLGLEVANYRIEVSARAFVGQRGVPERIFAMVVEACEDGLPPIRNIRQPVADLVAYTYRMAKTYRIDGRLRQAIEMRYQRLGLINEVVTKHLHSGHPLVKDISGAEEALARLL